MENGQLLRATGWFVLIEVEAGTETAVSVPAIYFVIDGK